MLKAYISYRKNAVNAHGIHSPFVFEFYNEVVLKAKALDDEYIQHVRRTLLKDNREIEITDLGQGSKKGNSNSRKISELVKVQAVDRKYGRLLGRLVSYYKLDTCLELGTSLGIGTAHMAEYAKKVITIEGCPNIYSEAKKFWSPRFGNIEFVNAEFSSVLPQVLSSMDKLDLVYIDGNHGYEPTMDYFKQILSKAHNDTFIIFDDINWSEGMRRAWDEICSSKEIHVSMEFFRMGIVLKRHEQAKEHFVLKF